MVVMLLAVLVKLVFIQGIDAQALAAQGIDLRDRTTVLPATRGSVLDRNGNPLAFTIEGRAIAARPKLFTDDVAPTTPPKKGQTVKPVLTAQQKREKVADIVVSVLGDSVKRSDILAKLTPPASFASKIAMDTYWADHKYVYLVRGILPEQADKITTQTAALFDIDHQNAIAVERQDLRQQPADGKVAATIVGTTNRDGHGQSGIEAKLDALLSGTDGSRTEQVDARNRPIPDTISAQTPVVNGTDVYLSIDSDMQFIAQQYLLQQIKASKAKSGCVIVRDVGSDGQIRAMACAEPGKTDAEVGNRAISTPFEPGSVNKVVTFAAALERGLITPTTVLNVDGQIRMGGRDIHDAWVHGPIEMTATGVLAKSSNVGTLMIAQKVGEDAFAAELAKFGLGRKTGIELGGESAGILPPRTQWSATTFANLPIGQGVAMTMVQLVDMYAAIGNKGVLVSPTLIAGTGESGSFIPAKAPATSRVMSEKTAATLLSMLTATTQEGDLYHRGTGPAAAITGYQVAGKTGTAQQIDPKTKAYSDTLITATFAGVVPADNPKYAIAVMIDAPTPGSEGGTSAAPLFHDVAAYAMRQAAVPPSTKPAHVYDLYVPPAG